MNPQMNNYAEQQQQQNPQAWNQQPNAFNGNPNPQISNQMAGLNLGGGPPGSMYGPPKQQNMGGMLPPPPQSLSNPTFPQGGAQQPDMNINHLPNPGLVNQPNLQTSPASFNNINNNNIRPPSAGSIPNGHGAGAPPLQQNGAPFMGNANLNGKFAIGPQTPAQQLPPSGPSPQSNANPMHINTPSGAPNLQQQNGSNNPYQNMPPSGMMPPPGNQQFPPQPSPAQTPSMPPLPNQGGMSQPMPQQLGGQNQPQMPPPASAPMNQQQQPQAPQPSAMPPKFNQGMPPQPGQQYQTLSSQPGQQGPSMQQQPGMPPLPGQQAPQMQHSGMPPQPGQQVPTMQPAGMPPKPSQYPGMPPQPGQHPGMLPPLGQQPGMPPQPGQQPGMPPQPVQQPGMQQQQQQPYPGQQQMPRMPPMPGQTNAYPSYPQQQMPGMQPQMPGMQQQIPGLPPQPGAYPQQGQQQMPGRNYPQQPQQPGMYPAPGQYPGGHMPQGGLNAAPQRRLDPDQMPNPIQVVADNQKTCAGVFITNQAGLVPPLVTTKFITQDQGNSGPRYIRSSMYNVPATADLMKQCAVPFSLIVSPFANTIEKELTPPIVDFGEMGPVRCVRCKAYMSPFMQFIDAGRRFQCMFCKATTEVPAEYFQHLDHTGQRVDKYERPELVLGTYEFVATKDYCRNNKPPKSPAFIFVIDVSYNNIKSGLVQLLCNQMKEIIKHLPVDQQQQRTSMKVGFITYNNTVHFYNIKGNLAQPQMMVVGDLQEMFMPLLDGFLCDAEESSAVIDSLMEQIPKMFSDTRETETILLPAIQAGLEALKASETTGKLLVFHSSLPIAEAPGKLKNRDDRKLLGTEKEKTVLTPQNTVYNNLGQECVGAGCSVDLFIFNNSYIDLATIGQVSRLTGGEIYKYTYFQADIDGQRLINDVIKNVSRPIAFDTVMRVRTSTGVRPTDFYGHFFMSNTTDMEIASIDCDKSIAIEIKHDDKLAPEENVYIQVALLYTSCGGQRRLRILNLSLKTCTQLADLFRASDLDSTILFFAKQGLFKLLENTPKQIKDGLINRAAQILACYRKHCASPTSSGQLILPDCMKLLPLNVLCLLKNDSFVGGSDITLDDRSYAIHFVLSMDLPTSVSHFYPRLIPIHDVDTDSENPLIPDSIRCTSEKMLDDGAYILENGIHMFMWLGLGLSVEFTQSVFGAQCTQQIDTDRCGLPVFDNPLSRRVRGIVNGIQKEKPRCMRLTLVRQRDKLDNVLRHFLVEDRGNDGSASYVDFLCHMHKEIRTLLS